MLVGWPGGGDTCIDLDKGDDEGEGMGEEGLDIGTFLGRWSLPGYDTFADDKQL